MFSALKYSMRLSAVSNRLLRRTVRFGRRTYLSAAYSCEDAWKKRLTSPQLQKLDMEDFYHELVKVFKSGDVLKPVYFDVFANNITAEEQVDDLADIAHRFRRTANACHVFDSTVHAVIRSFVQFGRTEELLSMLYDRINYGLFPSYYESNFLMDLFLKKKDYKGAAKIAALRMLQEDFDNPLSNAMSLYSCYKFLQNFDPELWKSGPDPEPEPEEEVKIRVSFVPNPYFDDHFHITDPMHLTGKTLAWTGEKVGGEVGTSLELIGWACYHKWTTLKERLEVVVKTKQKIYKEAVAKCKEVLDTFSSADNNEFLDELRVLLTQLETSGNLNSSSLEDATELLLKDCVAKFEPEMIANQTKLYDIWEKKRIEADEEAALDYKRKLVAEEHAAKKLELEEREEKIFFFDYEKERDLEMLQLEEELTEFTAGKTLKPKKKVKEEEEEYIPPEIQKTYYLK